MDNLSQCGLIPYLLFASVANSFLMKKGRKYTPKEDSKKINKATCLEQAKAAIKKIHERQI